MSDPAQEETARSGPAALFRELRKRRVIQTALYYVAVSVAVVEGADTFAAPLGLPDGTVRALAILAVSGLPLALALSWVFDISGSGAHSFLGRAGRAGLIAGTGATSLLLAGLLWSDRPPTVGDPLTETLPVNRIAVLAFEAPGASPDVEALAQHLHGRLIDGLSEAVAAPGAEDADRVRVISRAGVLPFSGGGLTMDSIGRALGVGTIVEGTVEEGGDSIRVRLRLIDAASADQIRAEVASASRQDPITLADDLTVSGVDLIRAPLGAVVLNQARRLGTRSPEAFRHVILADRMEDEFDRAMERRDLEGARISLATADSLYREASALDRDWVEPVVERGLLADRHAQLAVAGGGGDAESAYRRGFVLAEDALQIDPTNRRALLLRGQMTAQMAGLSVSRSEAGALRGDAERDLRAAIVGNPRPASALRTLSELLADRGDFEEALALGNQAYAEDRYLQNIHSTLLRLFQYSLRLGRDADALRHCVEGARRFPEMAIFLDCRLTLMAWTGEVTPEPDSAWALMRRELDGYPAALRHRLEPRLVGLVAAVVARAGMPDSARAVLAGASDDGTSGFALVSAGVSALVGDEESALAYLGRVVGADATSAGSAPELRPFREVPRLRAALDSAVVGSREGTPGEERD